MRRYILPVFLALLMLAAVGVTYAQKITVDPNSIPKVETEDKPDTRLDQKVTYEAKNKCVSAIFADLTKLTGVKLSAGVNQQDWQVRDRKMNIFAKNTSLKDLMDSTARVMKFIWADAGKGDKITYRIFMDRKTLLDAESRIMRDKERSEQLRAEQIKKSLKEFANPNPPTDAELAQMKKDKPLAYLAAKSGWSTGMGRFFQEAPMALDAMASGKQMQFNSSSLSPAAQANLVTAVKAMESLSFGGKISDDLASIIANATIRINQNMDLIPGGPMNNLLLGLMQVQAGERSYEIPLVDPDSNYLKTIGKILVRAQDEGVRPDEIIRSSPGLEDEVMQAMTSDMKAYSPGEEAPKHPDDPALLAKIKLQINSQFLADTQSKLQEASKFAIVSDSFGQSYGLGRPLPTDEITIKEALEKLGDAFQYDWDKHAGVIEFRDKKWYSKRANQIPEAWLEKWRNTFKETGTLDLDVLSEIASLSMDQIQQNITPDPVLSQGEIINMVYMNRELPKLYASLTDSQRKQVLSATGLDLATLSDSQWQLAEALISKRSSSFLQSPNARLTLSATKTANGKHYDYEFKITTSEDIQTLSFSIQTPEYHEPPKEAPKDNKDKPTDGNPDSSESKPDEAN